MRTVDAAVVIALGMAVLVGIGVLATGRVASTGAVVVRLALALCGVGFLAAATVYFVDGYRGQATGHGVAGVGFVAVAAGGGGVVLWIGVLFLIAGGVTLVRLGRGPRRQIG